MAFKVLARTREQTLTTGTGSLALGGVVGPNCVGFADGMSTGDTTYVMILSGNLVDWEECLATFTSPSTLARTTVITNNSGTTSHISLTGTSKVFAIIPNAIETFLAKLAGFTGDSGSGGSVGLVPAPAAGDAAAGKVLGAGGGWVATVNTLVGDSGSGGTKGLVPAPAAGDAAAGKVLGAGGGWVATVNNFVGDSGSGGTKGLVPAPGAGDAAAAKFLDAGGAWSVPAGTTGGGLFNQVLGTTPTQAGTGFNTQVNSGISTPTYTDGPTGISIQATTNASAQGISYVTKTAPSAGTKTATALVAMTCDMANANSSIQFGYCDGTKMQVISFNFSSSAVGCSLHLTNMTSKTVLSGDTAFGDPSKSLPPFIWLQLHDDGTNVHFRTSYDGGTFLDFSSILKSTGFLGSSGYSNVIFGINPFNQTVIGTLMSYIET